MIKRRKGRYYEKMDGSLPGGSDSGGLMTGCSGTKETKDTAVQTTASAAETKETGKQIQIRKQRAKRAVRRQTPWRAGRMQGMAWIWKRRPESIM